jgi:hypothetical protein
MNAEVLPTDEWELTDAEWERITAVCPGMPNDARPRISSVISLYRHLTEYSELERRYDEAATLARKTAELIRRIEQYQNSTSVPEALRPAWQENVEGLDKLVEALTLWRKRFQETERREKLELKVSRHPVRLVLQYLMMVLGRKLDRSKEVEALVATVLEIADPGMKEKNIGWQIRTAVKEWRWLMHATPDDEGLILDGDTRVQESIKRLIPNLDT